MAYVALVEHNALVDTCESAARSRYLLLNTVARGNYMLDVGVLFGAVFVLLVAVESEVGALLTLAGFIAIKMVG